MTQDELDVAKLRGDDLAAELEFMRKNEGFTERRLNPTGMLAEVLREKPDDSFERVRSRFLSAIHAGSNEMSSLSVRGPRVHLGSWSVAGFTETASGVAPRRSPTASDPRLRDSSLVS